MHCHFVGGTSQLVRSTCKLFRAPQFMLLIVPYNFVCYNCISITQWLVRKMGFALAKKCTVASILGITFFCLRVQRLSSCVVSIPVFMNTI